MESAGACNALIVAGSEKGGKNPSAALFSEALAAVSVNVVDVCVSAEEARRMLSEKDFDFVIIDAPLCDGSSGENLARSIAFKGSSQVILAADGGHFNAAGSVCGEDGVFMISKPVNRDVLLAVLSFAKSVSGKLKRIQDENAKLKQKIDDIRVIDRAKCILISYLKLTEQEAHRFIEKQSMDLRSTKRLIAEEILKTYAN